jgi:serine protease Do
MLRRATIAMAAAALAFGSARAEARELNPREIYKVYSKAVVLIFATDGSAQGSAGTGSIISKDGEVITNAHVVSKEGTPFKKVFIYLKPDKLVGSMKDDLKARYKATILELDPQLDLALLKMEDPPPDLQVMAFGDPQNVEIGQPVVAIGHPETGGLWTLTTGAISSVVKDFQGVDGKDVFQTEASVNRGNSGGPLIDAYGHMVGINTCISRRAADGLAITSINFSLKSSVPVEWMKKRKLMTLVYAKPEIEPTVLAALDGKASPSSGDSAAASAAIASAPKVDAGDGKTKVAIVEPKKGEEVADDPDFTKQAQAKSETKVSGQITMGKNPPKAAASVEPKQLTKARPYKLEPFISDRMKEIKALENLMQDEERYFDGKTKNKGKKKMDEGNGLW